MAGARFEKKLTALLVKPLNAPGKSEDGGGLRLVVDTAGSNPKFPGLNGELRINAKCSPQCVSMRTPTRTIDVKS